MVHHADVHSTLEAEEEEDTNSKPGCTARPYLERRKKEGKNRGKKRKGKKAETREWEKFYKLIT